MRSQFLVHFALKAKKLNPNFPVQNPVFIRKMASLSESCCTTPPVQSDYTPIGKFHQLDGMQVYETGDKNAKNLLVCFYDIFGILPNAQQVCDILGTKYRVVMPDFFRENAWDFANFPPKERSELLSWVDRVGNWNKTVKSDLIKVLDHYKKPGGKVGCFGFCWGGKMSYEAGCDLDEIAGIALIHAAFPDIKDAERVKCPVYFLPSGEDPDSIPSYNIVKERLGADSAQHYRFEDMIHGFAAARGNFKDPTNRARVDELIQMMNEFFGKHFNK